MATLDNLINELEVSCKAPQAFLEQARAYVIANGKGIYSISSEYSDFTIFKEAATSLEDIRKEVQDGEDGQLDEDEESCDYFADFNTPEDAAQGFLFGEGWFSVDITA